MAAGSMTEDGSPTQGQTETRSDDSGSLSPFSEQIGRRQVTMDGQESITSSQVLGDGTPKTPWNAKSKGLRDILLKPPDLRTEVEIEEVFAAIERLQDPFLANLDQPVKRAMCQRLTWEEFQENEQIFDFGSVGDKLYIVWSGRVQLEVPDEKTSTETELHFVKGAKMDSGKVFGEIALMSEDCKRKGRCTALKPTQLLIFYRDDYKWCVGASQETTVKERVAFLRMAEEGLLADMRYVDLQALAGSLTEDFYIGEHEIIRQGTEVERIIFVKSGFCKIVRELHPKYTKVFCRYANYAEPMPNPYAEGEGGLRVGEKGVWPRPQQPKPAAAARVAAQNASTPREGETEKKSTLKLESHQMLKKMLRLVQGEHEEGHVRERRTRTDTNSSSSAEETSQEKTRSLKVVVDIISKGSSVGVMELMEGLTYQCTVVCSPLAEIYSISRYDFIRNGPRPITHRLFCNYKARLSDKQLIWRLVQKHRWDHYKRGLLEEIRSWNSSASRGIVDREDPVPMIGGSALEDQTCIRIGRGEKLWDQRAQTPPNQAYDPDQAVKQIFHVQCSRDEQGKPLVQVEREQRDASMDEFERKLLETMANARYRDKLRRAKQKHAASHSALEDKGANAVAIAQALEEEAKRSLEEQKQKEKERIEVMRQEVQAKVKLDRDASREKRNRRTLTARPSMRAPPSGAQSVRSRQSTKQVELPPLPGSRKIVANLLDSLPSHEVRTSSRRPRRSMWM